MRSSLVVLVACIVACRSTVRTIDARPPLRAAPDASVDRTRHTESTPPITSSDALPTIDRASITACGALVRRGVGPLGSVSSLYVWGLRFVGEWQPELWLGPFPPWPGAGEGHAREDLLYREEEPPRVCATGRFYTQYPLASGDPPHANRFAGKWLFVTSIAREPMSPSTEPAITTPERWRTRWQLEANLIAQLGDRTLVRTDRTSDEVTFALHQTSTGQRLSTIPWLSTALPHGQRTYRNRFTFAGRFVSVLQGEPATRTAVFELETGRERLSVPRPDALRLAELAGGDVVAMVAALGSLRALDAATGATRWRSATSHRNVSIVSTSPTALLSFESPSSESEREGTLVWRDARTGRVRWSAPFRERSYEPILVAWSADAAWIAQGSTLLVASERGERARWTVDQRITDLRVAADTAIVSTLDHRLLAFSEGLGRARWDRAIDAHCVDGGDRSVFALIADTLWREVDPRTGETLYELGGGHCQEQFSVLPLQGDPQTALFTWPSRIELRERSDALVARRPLRITGRVTLDARAVPDVRVRLGALSTQTDASGRFAFELIAEGEFSIGVDDELDHLAPGRCIRQRSNPGYVLHGREGGTRDIHLELLTHEPNPMTRCSPM